MKKDNYLDEFFREKLENHEEIPPPNLWDKIDEDLNKKTKIVNVVSWKWIAGMAASILVLFGAIQLYDNSNGSAIDNIVKEGTMKNGMLELSSRQIEMLLKEIDNGGDNNMVVVGNKVLKEERINLNFSTNSPKKGLEVQYYVDKNVRVFDTPTFEPVEMTPPEPFYVGGIGRTVSSK